MKKIEIIEKYLIIIIRLKYLYLIMYLKKI
ncbi:hypothetical protein QG37_04182 [Candidozyma auris]|uniref:Uncharacterized protein n=1 Tax=Candidozyma auris TaxID=498019 RepID=A0A0L0NY90_CANAR|nr:hypothetical protein QG37_04182 [[Candida] auris]